jgi:hypothetical protein
MDYKFVELKQRHIEAFHKDMPSADKVTMPVYNGAVVRNAIRAGWFDGWEVKPEFVDDMKPSEVRKLAELVVKEYARIMEVSPE